MSDAELLSEQKRLILPFLTRAQEIQSVDPKVAYYSRMYAVTQVLQVPRRHPAITDIVKVTLAQMEKDKSRLALGQEDQAHCESFALKVFANADRVDRAGKASIDTCKAFFAAAQFVEMLNQFAPNDEDLLGKQKYALWRASEIRKAVREGRPPVPPPADSQELMDGAGPFAAASSLESGTSFPSADPWAVAGAQQAPPGGGQGASSGSQQALNQAFEQRSQSPPPKPPPPALFAPPVPKPAGALLSGQRYRPGSRVLFCESAGIGRDYKVETGTMGQVSQDQDENFRYRVALPDRLVQAQDFQVAPAPPEGTPVTYSPDGTPPQPATCLLVNDDAWPPTYLVQLRDGSERAAKSHELSMLLPEEATAASGISQSPLPPPGSLPDFQSYGGANSWRAAPPPAPPAQQDMYPSVGSVGSGPLPDNFSSRGTAGSDALPDSSNPNMGSSGSAAWGAPSPGAPSGASAHGGSGGYGQQPPPSAAPLPQGPSGQYGQHVSAPVPRVAAPVPPVYAAPLPQAPPGFTPSMTAMTDAQKAARCAISSLNFEDVDSALKYLHQAIANLSTPGR